MTKTINEEHFGGMTFATTQLLDSDINPEGLSFVMSGEDIIKLSKLTSPTKSRFDIENIAVYIDPSKQSVAAVATNGKIMGIIHILLKPHYGSDGAESVDLKNIKPFYFLFNPQKLFLKTGFYTFALLEQKTGVRVSGKQKEFILPYVKGRMPEIQSFFEIDKTKPHSPLTQRHGEMLEFLKTKNGKKYEFTASVIGFTNPGRLYYNPENASSMAFVGGVNPDILLVNRSKGRILMEMLGVLQSDTKPDINQNKELIDYLASMFDVEDVWNTYLEQQKQEQKALDEGSGTA